MLIADGGGVFSTAAWLTPQEGGDILKKWRCWGLVPRLLEHVAAKGDAELLTATEISSLQVRFTQFLASKGYPRR